MQAAGGWARLAHAIPVLADFPAMDVPFTAAEAPQFPPLGWQQPAARTAVMALAGIGTWLQVGTFHTSFVFWLVPDACCCLML